MADAAYKEYPFIFASRGVIARKVDDTASPQEFLNLDNLEELAENAQGTRLGTAIINGVAPTPYPLGAAVHSIAKLGGLGGAAWRYAGTTNSDMWRISGLANGPYTLLTGVISASAFSAATFRPDASAQPYIYFANSNGMFKDNGRLSALQQMGIFQPRYPVVAQTQKPNYIILDNYIGLSTDYTYAGISGGTIVNYVSTNAASPVFSTGLGGFTVNNPNQLEAYQLLVYDTTGTPETILVLGTKSPSSIPAFQAYFTLTHAIGSVIQAKALQVTVPASTTATVSKTFGGTPISSWPTLLSQDDYIIVWVNVSDPLQVRSIILKFDCGDGSFNTDYFYKMIAQGPLQNLLDTVNDPTTSATDAILGESLGLYSNSQSGIAQLNEGLNAWTPFLIQLSDFAESGRAGFSDPTFNWKNVNGYQVQIVTNDQSSATVEIASLAIMGGSGPDTLGGVAYDYRFTFYNAVDGTESNGSMIMTNIDPPNNTGWVYPRRQPVQLTMKWALLDPQVTHLRIYRRGGTLGDNWRRVDQVAVASSPQIYNDQITDSALSSADILSLTNDVPISSALPTATFALLTGTITGDPSTPQVVTVGPLFSFSPGQLVTIGSPTDPANVFETVVVNQIAPLLGFMAVVQNNHVIGEAVQATERVGMPVTIMAQAYNQMWFAGDVNNPSLLYWSLRNSPQSTSAAFSVEISTPDDPITAIVPFKGNLYVSTLKGWWAVAPGSNSSAAPTVYPTACKHGCVASFGWTATEEAIFYQAVDGIRAFAGGASSYLTQDLEFIFQGIGTTPFQQADLTQLSSTTMAYWNNMVFVSYVGLDGKRHRVIYHTIYKRWRNDDIDAKCMILEADTNSLVYGDSVGYIHQDRINRSTDDAVVAGVLGSAAIPVNLQSSYQNQGMPERQKNYNDFTLDCNTGGQNVTVTLLFNDGQSSLVLGTVNTVIRQKVNMPINSGQGVQAYNVALQVSGSPLARIYIYQGAIKAVPLAITRQSFDTYWMKLGGDDSKFARDVFFEYTATSGSNITMNVYYDGSSTPGMTFTLPHNNGVRNSLRRRLPATSFRLIRFTATAASDFQIWEDSSLFWKFQCQGRGYEKAMFMPN